MDKTISSTNGVEAPCSRFYIYITTKCKELTYLDFLVLPQWL